MNIEDLRTIALIHELGSFSRAAAHLHLSQSSVSHRVRQVDHDLGVPLFVRDGRRMRLSMAGERLVAISEDIDERLRALRRESPGAEGEHRLTIASPEPSHILPGLLPDLFARAPLATVRLVSLDRPETRTRLIRGELDFGLLDQATVGRNVNAVLLGHTRWVLLAHKDHPIVANRAPTAREIAQHAFIEMQGLSRPTVAAAWATMTRVQLRIGLEAPSGPTLVEALRLGLGLAFSPLLSCRQAVADGTLKIIPAVHTPILSTVYMGYRQGVERTVLGALLLEIIREGKWRAQVPGLDPP